MRPHVIDSRTDTERVAEELRDLLRGNADAARRGELEEDDAVDAFYEAYEIAAEVRRQAEDDRQIFEQERSNAEADLLDAREEGAYDATALAALVLCIEDTQRGVRTLDELLQIARDHTAPRP